MGPNGVIFNNNFWVFFCPTLWNVNKFFENFEIYCKSTRFILRIGLNQPILSQQIHFWGQNWSISKQRQINN